MVKFAFSATAKSQKVLEVYVNKDFCSQKLAKFFLYIDGKKAYQLNSVSQSESNSSFIYTFMLKDSPFIVGKKYEVLTEQNYFIPVDISFLAMDEAFEKKFRFDGELGAIYSKKKTIFRVFSPFATRVILVLERKDGKEEETFIMHRDNDTGVYETEVSGDLDEAKYIFECEIFSHIYKVVDPYAYALTSNSRKGYVVNPDRVKEIMTNRSSLPAFDDVTKAIIYECSVRDMTSLTGRADSGTYDALTLEGLRSKEGMPMGMGYLSSLGLSHIQLLPVLDFQTINDDNPKGSYNWGYDPMFFFAPEGSYSKNPDDPYNRVLALRKLVSTFHKNGLRVNLDVVYNHVYSERFNSLSVLVPKYYFRHNQDGSLSNGTGCGNDFESRNYMARKLIIDSLLHALDFYDVDGFRFDLMGILDVDTINLGYEACKKVRSDIMFYGEGWDMWTPLPAGKEASLFNSEKMGDVAFFNDRFRDIVKGKSNTSELSVKGYLLGDGYYIDGFKHVMMGSCYPLAFAPMLSSYRQSVNYVECHDNNTLYDKIKAACPDETDAEVYKRIKMILVAVLFASGIPFFHEGQEIGHSKNGKPNTYNTGDKDNGFDYQLLSERKELYHFFIEAIALKKKFIALMKDNYLDLPSHMSFVNLTNGALRIDYEASDSIVSFVYNPTNDSIMCDFEDYVRLVFNDTGSVEDSEFFIRLAIIPAKTVSVFLKKKAGALSSWKENEK